MVGLTAVVVWQHHEISFAAAKSQEHAVNNLPRETAKMVRVEDHYDHRWPYLPIVLLLTCFLLLAAADLRDIASDPV